MAVLFSAVTLTADNNQVEFLAAGIPRDSDDLEGWTAYENFMDELDSEQEVSVHVDVAQPEGREASVSAFPKQDGQQPPRRTQAEFEAVLGRHSDRR